MRPLALAFGVGRVAAAWSWAAQRLHGKPLAHWFTEPLSGRPYRVITRADHDPARRAPVLFALHAYATPPDVLVRGYSLEALAVLARGMILVVPEGQRDSTGQYFWNATRACCGEGPARPDDLGYLRSVLAEVKARFTVDPRQVMVLGVSNGGFMAHRWACAAGGELSAIASISGAGVGPDDAACAPAAPLSVLQVHGDADELIAYAGGFRRAAAYPSARRSLEPYLRAAGLAGSAPQTHTSHTLLWGAIEKEDWRGPAARVALWTVRGGAHHLRAAQGSVPDILDFLQGS